MEDPACIAVQHRILWKCRNDNLTTTKYVNIESQEEISQRFKIRPPRRTLFHLCSNAVVVVQEFALTCFLLARHHIALFYNQDAASPQQHVYLELSTAAIVLALLTAVVFSARADQSQQQDRKTKIIQRSSDAILLGLLLRWMAGILHGVVQFRHRPGTGVGWYDDPPAVLRLFVCEWTGYCNHNNSTTIGDPTRQRVRKAPLFRRYLQSQCGSFFHHSSCEPIPGQSIGLSFLDAVHSHFCALPSYAACHFCKSSSLV